MFVDGRGRCGVVTGGTCGGGGGERVGEIEIEIEFSGCGGGGVVGADGCGGCSRGRVRLSRCLWRSRSFAMRVTFRSQGLLVGVAPVVGIVGGVVVGVVEVVEVLSVSTTVPGTGN